MEVADNQMAERRRSKPALFFEAIATAPQLPHAILFPTIVRNDRLRRTGLAAIRQLSSDALALLHDVWLLIIFIFRILTTRAAKLVTVAAVSGIIIAGTIVAVRIGMETLAHYGPNLSSPAAIMGMKNTGTTILDKNGIMLYQGYGAVDRRQVPLAQMPESVIQATLAAEDPDFYEHPGVSWRSILRAAYRNASENGKRQGGSTITQQLVKNTMLTSEKSFSRK
ncbi:MAG TPA: biosynthetic peptidoglycan transglycosylase, partial [Candidatus Polarisedimenticolaceae bacterium]|nr:biosynthetic peptidoglycan transglycosylase [Candidatus Polarisedimenticolaceae bacterium]